MVTKKKLAFTVTTTVFALCILPGAVLDIVQPVFVVEMGAILGVPLGLFALLGVWKLLGAVALAAPGLDRFGPSIERIREWAYAGFFFDLTGAAYLHVIAGDYNGVVAPLVFTALLLASYFLRPSEAVSPRILRRSERPMLSCT